MSAPGPWVDDQSVALLTDLYQLTMMRGYFEAGMADEATFSLFVRRLPEHRGYLLACGIDDVLRYLENLHFTEDDCAYLASFDEFPPAFLDWLGELRFTGEVRAVREGTPVFADEPILEVTAPIAEAQLAETFVMNQVHLQTVLASKAARLVKAAGGRPVIDFGPRRMHGTDAALKAARAFHVAGVAATSNVLAGRFYGVPVTGTMAHSFIQACPSEMEAFRIFARTFPETVLLIDTYDTMTGAENVVALARELGEAFRVRGVRLDSGDLADLSRRVRRLFDDNGLDALRIFVSSSLDEHRIAELVEVGRDQRDRPILLMEQHQDLTLLVAEPVEFGAHHDGRRPGEVDRAVVDGFGVGTKMGVSADAPSLDIAYKLAAYAGEGRVKLSSGKPILPGRKQVFRVEEDGATVRDLIARADEEQPGRPLLRTVMRDGRRLDADDADLAAARERAAREVAALPDTVRGLAPADPGYPVETTDALDAYHDEVKRQAARRG